MWAVRRAEWEADIRNTKTVRARWARRKEESLVFGTGCEKNATHAGKHKNSVFYLVVLQKDGHGEPEAVQQPHPPVGQEERRRHRY